MGRPEATHIRSQARGWKGIPPIRKPAFCGIERLSSMLKSYSFDNIKFEQYFRILHVSLIDLSFRNSTKSSVKRETRGADYCALGPLSFHPRVPGW